MCMRALPACMYNVMCVLGTHECISTSSGTEVMGSCELPNPSPL